MGLTSLTGTLFRASSTPVSKLKMWTSNAPSNQINNLKTIQNYGWNWLTLTICDIQYPGNDSSCGEQSIGAGTVKGTRYISAHSHFTTYTGCLSAFVNICSIESTHTHTHARQSVFNWSFDQTAAFNHIWAAICQNTKQEHKPLHGLS